MARKPPPKPAKRMAAAKKAAPAKPFGVPPARRNMAPKRKPKLPTLGGGLTGLGGTGAQGMMP